MGLELYLDLISQPCRSVYIFAKKNNIPFEFKHVELLKGHNIQEFSNISTLKKVPILKDGNFTLSESTAILLYLSRKYNTPDHWYPSEIQKRARVDEYMSWQHTTVRANASKILWLKWSDGEQQDHATRPRVFGRFGASPLKVYTCTYAGKTFVVQGYKKHPLSNVVIPLFTGKPIPLEKLQEALDELNNSLKKFIEKFLQDKPFIVGSEISLADLMAITELMQPAGAGCNIFEGQPKLVVWRNQVEEAVGKDLFQEAHEQILNAQDLRNIQIDPQMKEQMKPQLLKMLK